MCLEESSFAHRIALGTAQFGMDYGIAGSRQVTLEEVRRILKLGRLHRIDTLDTAIAYKESEKALGEASISQWRTVTKLPAMSANCEDVMQWVLGSVHGSLERLRIPKLYGLLLHRPSDLLGNFGRILYSGLQACKDKGLVRKIGISVYDPSELDAILSCYPMDLIQAPFNVLDRRLEANGMLDHLHDSGVEVHVRSVFLQGLLLMSPKCLPKKFKKWEMLWKQWNTWLEERKITALRACLQFVLGYPEIDRVVVGIDSQAQLQDILENSNGNEFTPKPLLMSDDTDLINPSRWRFL